MLLGQLRQEAMKWWINKSRNDVHEFLLQCLLTVICWEIWKNRCTARFENKKISAWNIIQKVDILVTMAIKCHFTDIQLPGRWHDKCKMIEKLSPMIQSKVVLWIRPDLDWVKLNVDGCSKDNPGSHLVEVVL